MFIERLENFLSAAGNASVVGELTPDASTREYYRVDWKGKTGIACVYPFDELGRTQFAACLDVTGLFLAGGLPVASILASDEEAGIIVHEDFGDTILRDVLLASSDAARDEYLERGIALIAKIQAATELARERGSVASKLKFDREKLGWELNFFKTHYFTTLRGRPLAPVDETALDEEFADLSAELEICADVLTHRDFHAANLMLDAGELRIIDHQDARLGSAAYDLVSLLLDRVTTLPTPEWLLEKRRLLDRHRIALGLPALDETSFTEEFRLQTIQRCLKAIGTFSFQAANRGKTHFIEYIVPMFEIVLRAAENLDRFPALRRIVAAEISNS